MDVHTQRFMFDNEICEKKCLQLANKLIVNFTLLIPRITTRMEFKAKLYYILFQHIFGFQLKSNGDERNMFSQLLKALETILAANVDHIEVQALCDRELQSHFFLLEILDACNKYLPKLSDCNLSKITKKSVSKFVQTDTSKTNSNSSTPLTTSTPSSSSSCIPSVKSNSYSSFSICDCPDIIQSTPEFDEYKNGFNYSTYDDEKQRYEDVNIGYATEPKQIMTIEEDKEGIKSLKAPTKRFLSRPSEKTKAKKITELSSNQWRLAKKKELNEKLDLNAPRSQLLEQLKAMTIENFALDVGKRLHSALKLKEKTKQIADNIEKLNQLVDNPTKMQRSRTAVTPRRKSGSQFRGQRVKSAPLIRSKKIVAKDDSKPKTTLTDNLKTVSVDDFLPKYSEVPRCLLKVMRQYESRQKQVIANLEEDIKISESRVTNDLKDAILKQVRKSALLRDDVQHMQNLERIKSEEIAQLSEAGTLREWRIERARIHKFVENYHREMLSKFKMYQAREERLVREEFFRRLQRQKEDLLEFKKRMKEEESKEVRKQRMFLDAFETLYNNNFELLKQSLDEQQTAIKKRLLQRTTSLNKLRTQYTHRINDQMKSVCK